MLKSCATPKVLLVANYEPDRQTSMLCFASMLANGLATAGHEVEVLRPTPVVGRFGARGSGPGKWLGYVDKFVIFPHRLRRRAQQARLNGERLVVHICDHSNSPYVRQVARLPHLITCHDLLAVRSALGEFPQNVVRWSGRRLQTAILDGLRRAAHVSCVSMATRADVQRICGLDDARVSVVPNGLHHPYRPLPRATALARVRAILPPGGDSSPPVLGRQGTMGGVEPFLLHVGSNAWYKNRLGVLQIYRALLLRRPAAPRLVMVGPSFTSEMMTIAAQLPLSHRVIQFENVTPKRLEALYSLAELLLFPSLEEGFGWPILEALACGCSVVTSNRAPMTEVGGAAAEYIDAQSPRSAATVVADVLADAPGQRALRVRAGIAQANRFTTRAMRDCFGLLYLRLFAEHAGLKAGAQPWGGLNSAAPA